MIYPIYMIKLYIICARIDFINDISYYMPVILKSLIQSLIVWTVGGVGKHISSETYRIFQKVNIGLGSLLILIDNMRYIRISNLHVCFLTVYAYK